MFIYSLSIRQKFAYFFLFHQYILHVSSVLWDDKRAFNSRSRPSKEQLYIEYKTAYMQINSLYEIHEIFVWH